MEKVFDKQKTLAISGIDLSKKGSIDSKILNLSNYINDQSYYFTTSSCSGRIILFDDKTEDNEKVTKKKGCHWLFTSHELVNISEIVPVLKDITGDCVFKFEPFVLHVQCRTLHHAQVLLQCAVQSGFRNSGISIGKKGKILVGIRSTHSMEVPLSHMGQLLVSSEYVEYLAKLANKKMTENFRRIDRFFDNLKCEVSKLQEDHLLVGSTRSKTRQNKKHNKVKGFSSHQQSTDQSFNQDIIHPDKDLRQSGDDCQFHGKDTIETNDYTNSSSKGLTDDEVLDFSLFGDEIT